MRYLSHSDKPRCYLTRSMTLLATLGAITMAALQPAISQSVTAAGSARSPRELHQALASAFNAKDLDRVSQLYEQNASLVPEPGKSVSGMKAVKEALKGFLAIDGKMHIDTIYALESGDVALTRSAWSIRNGSEVKIAAAGTELMRRQKDGSWLFVVDHPFGAEAKR